MRSRTRLPITVAASIAIDALRLSPSSSVAEGVMVIYSEVRPSLASTPKKDLWGAHKAGPKDEAYAPEAIGRKLQTIHHANLTFLDAITPVMV